MTTAPTSAATISYHCSSLVHDPVWDALLAIIPGSHYEQLSGWGAVKAHYGWQVRRIVAREGETMVGGVQVLTRRIGRWGRIGYISRGPMVLPGHENIARDLVGQVEDLARKEHWLYGVFDYPYASHQLATGMRSAGYIDHPPGIPPSGLLAATCLVDLSGEEEEILSRMNASVRRNIRRSLRSDLVFAEGGETDILRFRELMLATCARRKSTPTPPQKNFFHLLWSELASSGRVRLFLVRKGDEIISAAFCLALSDTMRVWKVGWSGAQGDKDPNHLLWWEMMRWGKAHGFRKLDFVWVDTADAKRAARGEMSPEGFQDGTTYFKLGFGSTLLFPPPVQSRFFNPLLRLAYNCGGRQVLASRNFQRMLARYWSRASGQ